MPENDFFSARNIVKQFTGHLALDEVSLNIPRGTIYGLLGPNGAGKTTLLRIINQITAPDQGTILFKGKPLAAEDVQHIGYLPEERGLYKKMQVGEQALYLARLKGMSKHDALSGLKYWFERFEIQGWWNKKVEELSKGMQQKVQFIVTILHKPELLIFDEPFSGFDPINASLLKNEILTLRKNGSTILFSTHDMASVEELCDHITLINKSRTILEGEVHDIRMRYRMNEFEVVFRGSPEPVVAALNGNYAVIRQGEIPYGNVLRVKAFRPGPANELLELLLPVTEVLSFNEVIPSMNEVFIHVVESQQKQSA